MEVSDRDGFRMLFDISNAKAGSDATVTMLDAGYVATKLEPMRDRALTFRFLV